MKGLKELIYILTKYRVQSKETIFDESIEQDSKLYQLYNLIKNAEIKTDEEAANLIYGEKELSPKYRNLKHNLKTRLLNSIFFINIKGTAREKAYYNCWKQWSACMILIEKSASYSASKIAEKLIKQAIKFEFCDLVVAVALHLRLYYSLRERNIKKFEYYNGLYHQYREIEEYQNLAHEYYVRLVMDNAIESVTVNAKIKSAGEKYYAELAPMKDRIPTIKFHHYLYQIQLLTAMGVFDYQKAKEICIEALQFLNSGENTFIGGIRNFQLNKLVCHIQLKEFEKGKATVLECEKLLENGAFNWFKAKEFFFMLSFNTANYQEAYYTYLEVTKHRRFNSYAPIFEETWLLFRMYLHFLYLIGKIQSCENEKLFNVVRLGKFLNQVPKFSKDKRGMNIPVLIIQMAFLILEKKYDAAIDKIESLEKYCSRYLRKDNPNFRCNCFIRMLLQIPISNFHRAGVERRASKFLNRMKTVKINYNNQAHEVEVLPFETLWQFILDSLDNKFQKVK